MSFVPWLDMDRELSPEHMGSMQSRLLKLTGGRTVPRVLSGGEFVDGGDVFGSFGDVFGSSQPGAEKTLSDRFCLGGAPRTWSAAGFLGGRRPPHLRVD